jgi:hypothetical protein
MKIDFIDEPELEFGAGRHIDIRFGLMNYGPLDLGESSTPKKINVGIVGTSETVDDLAAWLEKCRNGIAAKSSNQPNLFVKFPGFREDNVLNTTIVLNQQLQRAVANREFDRLAGLGGSPLAVQRAVEVFLDEIKALSEKRLANVILCAIPMSLLKQQGEAVDISDAEAPTHEQPVLDFHHLLKAKAMEHGVPIQLILPMTWDETKRLPQKARNLRLRSSQDEATRAWNLHVAMYYKSGGIPWRLPRASTALTSCHVGISFYESLDKARLLTSVAQVFNERGEGTIVRGGPAKLGKDDRQPHLSEIGAHDIFLFALKAYRGEHRTLPARIVIHKSSSFSNDELSGFRTASESLGIELLELLTLSNRETRLFRKGAYPPLRGTLLSLSDTEHVFYTRGSVDFYQTYPGLYAPLTLGIKIAKGEHSPHFLAEEILALTKMNWNKTQFDGFEPITLHAARQVGRILKYVPDGDSIGEDYAFYM